MQRFEPVSDINFPDMSDAHLSETPAKSQITALLFNIVFGLSDCLKPPKAVAQQRIHRTRQRTDLSEALYRCPIHGVLDISDRPDTSDRPDRTDTPSLSPLRLVVRMYRASHCSALPLKASSARHTISALVPAQQDFLEWWNENVGVRQSPGTNQHSSSVADPGPTLSREYAEEMTGITKQRPKLTDADLRHFSDLARVAA